MAVILFQGEIVVDWKGLDLALEKRLNGLGLSLFGSDLIFFKNSSKHNNYQYIDGNFNKL